MLAATTYKGTATAQKAIQTNTDGTIKKVGVFGDIIFETSDKKILTFNGFTQGVSGRWATHERIGLKPKQEFLGASLRTISFNMTLNASNGVKPREMLEKLESLVENGIANTLIVGTKPIGENQWIIKEISETWDVVMNKGELAKASLSLSLEEYV